MELTEDSSTAQRIIADMATELDAKGPKPFPHLTELIYCLTKSFYQRFAPLSATTQESLIFTMGVGLEQVLLRPHKQHQSGELDGIHYEADFLDYRDDVGELKSTRLSSKKGPEDFPEAWKQQLLGYMKPLGKTEATLAVFHALGNYRPPFPDLKVWHGVATQEEIDSNWQWLQDRKAVYLSH